jgi:hydrogenase maturation protease
MHFSVKAEIKKIAVVGIGNVLMGDDGFGPYLIRRIDSFYRFSSEVVLVEAGTPGMDLTALLIGFSEVLIIDTVRAPGKPGEIWKFTKDDIIEGNPVMPFSSHDSGLREALLTLQFTGEAPQKVVLLGVIPESLELGLELSDAVQGAVPEIIREVTSELQRLGATVEEKSPPDELDVWWKKTRRVDG